MPRVKGGVTTRRRHKSLLKSAKGYRGGRSKIFKQAKLAVMQAGMHAYRDRRNKKRDFRSLWISRINAALRARGIKYSRFIAALNEKDVQLDRKVLSELAIHEPQTFEAIMNFVQPKTM